jgi:hypothetical protein
MLDSVASLVSRLSPDPWRSTVGFSPELHEANQHLFESHIGEERFVEIVNDWIQKHQPCLFGRIAAKFGFLNHCILTSSDLTASDQHVCDKIQAARTTWTRDAYEGKTSGFIILAVSERIATAVPDDILKQLATRLCSLYLLSNIEPDAVCLDEIFLEMSAHNRHTWRWSAGVNYFAAQGDKRWWQDHRFPGGIAFSINSVGHMVKSAILANALFRLNSEMNVPAEDWLSSRVDSLHKAHLLAMKTIANASVAASGKATELLALPEGVHDGAIDVPHSLGGYDWREYLGHYHTDYTVPTEYFRPDVLRPSALEHHILDFTYLFDENVDNPDFINLGDGRLVRQEDIASHAEVDLVPAARTSKMIPQEVAVEQQDRLVAALSNR